MTFGGEGWIQTFSSPTPSSRRPAGTTDPLKAPVLVSIGTTLSLNYKLFRIRDAAMAVPSGDHPPMGHRFGCRFARFHDFNMIAVIDVANAIAGLQRRLRLWRWHRRILQFGFPRRCRRGGRRGIWVAISVCNAVMLESSLVSCAKNCEQRSHPCPADIDGKIGKDSGYSCRTCGQGRRPYSHSH